MPWTKADVEEHNKGLTDEQKEQWVEVANSALASCLDEGGEQDKCEASAIKQANAAVGKEEERKVGLIRQLWEGIQRVFEPHLEEERATNLGRLYGLLDSALYESAEHELAWLHDLYRDDDGSLFAITSERGKLYRVPLEFANDEVQMGEWVPVTEEFKPIEAATRTRVIRQADGRHRWLSISCTSVLNRVGEIDSKALFDSFVAHAEETGEYPYRTFYHQGEALRTGEADFLARDGNTFITSGLYDEDNPLALAEIEAMARDADKWGESIGYLPTSAPEMVEVAEDVTIPVYNAGVMQEISTLPNDKAAAWFTTVRTQEVRRMRPEVLDALRELVGDEELVEQFAALVDGTNREIEAGDLVSREADGEEEPAEEAPEEPTEEPAEEPEIEREVALDESAVELITAQFAEMLAPFTEKIEALEAQISALGHAHTEAGKETRQAREALDERIKAVEATDEEKQRQWLADLPRREKLTVTHRPREANASDEEPSKPDPSAVLDAAGVPGY